MSTYAEFLATERYVARRQLVRRLRRRLARRLRRLPAGDFGLCLRCGAESVYTGIGLTLREPTPEEAAEFAVSPDAEVQARLRRVNPLGWRASQ